MAMIFKIVYNSEWALQRLQKDDIIKILFIDKATFTNKGQVNLRNMHY